MPELNLVSSMQSPTFLGNFCKVVKIYHFSSEIIFGHLLQTFGDFFLVTLYAMQTKNERKISIPQSEDSNYAQNDW